MYNCYFCANCDVIAKMKLIASALAILRRDDIGVGKGLGQVGQNVDIKPPAHTTLLFVLDDALNHLTAEEIDRAHVVTFATDWWNSRVPMSHLTLLARHVDRCEELEPWHDHGHLESHRQQVIYYVNGNMLRTKTQKTEQGKTAQESVYPVSEGTDPRPLRSSWDAEGLSLQ